MITIKEARTKNSGNRSQNFRLNYIKNNPYFVPPIYSEEKICSKIITAITTRKAAYFLAYKDGVLSGSDIGDYKNRRRAHVKKISD